MERQMRIHAGPSDRAVFNTCPEAVADARDLARAFVGNLSPAIDTQASESVTLVVSELITNAVRHARSTSCTLQLRASPDIITIEVTDADPKPPRERTPDLTGGTGGFGWAMVQTLARAIHVTCGPKGKKIRADLPR
ncbi:ATP-binding protein [Streptomyces sp. NPDC090032]|uniref:ATP-binding protein n=1 Tax=Streptomyces sp. NPDC090032 TaxID=3365925 RepID=UPI0037FAD363